MPTLIKNGKNYSGTSVSLTQAEYDALTETQKNDGTVYFITDSDYGVDFSCLVIASGSFSSLPQTITNANITSEHVVVNSVLSNPSAQNGNWTVTTSNGSLTISGSISGSTTITLYLMRGV